jgi:hypothetical protein
MHKAPELADKAQRNFTDPESKLMRTKGTYEQAYNAHAAVDAENQIIVATDVTNEQNDGHTMEPMLDQVEANCGCAPDEVSADSGYCSEDNLAMLDGRGLRGYVATGRQKHGTDAATKEAKPKGPLTRAMKKRLKQGGYRSRYRLRKITVEPVFGQIKEARGFRHFLFRELARVRGEWRLACTAHNLLKLLKARMAVA